MVFLFVCCCFEGSELFNSSKDDFKILVFYKFFESVVVVFVLICVKCYVELLKSNWKFIWKEVDIVGLEIILLILFFLLCFLRIK